jgi:putative ABC transport system permease protein
VDSETFFEVYPEFLLERDQFEAFKRERNATIIGIEIAKRYNLKLGDIMAIEGDVYPGKWEFVVRGIYRPRDQSTDPATMMFHYKYVEEWARREMPTRAGDVGWYIMRIHDPNNSAAISETIDQLFANSRAETKTETERVFQQNFLSSWSPTRWSCRRASGRTSTRCSRPWGFPASSFSFSSPANRWYLPS